jgi:hypothetical protein
MLELGREAQAMDLNQRLKDATKVGIKGAAHLKCSELSAENRGHLAIMRAYLFAGV